MPNDTRLSRMLHVLIHMDHLGAPVTSEVIGRMLETHPVVVRRTLASLRDGGYVTSVRGHGGGWSLARSLDEVTLRDIHEALGRPKVVAIGLADHNPRCPIERAIHDALTDVIGEAERRLLARFGEVTLGAVSRSIRFPGQPPCDGDSRH